MTTLTPTDKVSFTVDGLAEGFECNMTCLPEVIPGVTEIAITFTAESPTPLTPTTIVWREPMHEIHHKWTPSFNQSRMLDISSSSQNRLISKIHSWAPVLSLYKI